MANYDVVNTVYGKFLDGRTVKVDIIEYAGYFSNFDISKVKDPLYLKYSSNEYEDILLPLEEGVEFELQEGTTIPTAEYYLKLRYRNNGSSSVAYSGNSVNGSFSVSTIGAKWFVLTKLGTKYYIVWYNVRDSEINGFEIEKLNGTTIYSWANALPKIVDFYRSLPEGDITAARGETVNLEFTAVYDDGSTVTPYTDVVYSDLPPESTAVFNGNSFTISDNCRASIFTSIAKPNIGETTLYAFVQAKISNPVNPYLPDDGGISGGGAQSGSSNVIGSFNGTPGPSIVGGIPDGAVGSDIASSGMYTKYLCDVGTLNVIAQYLWEDNVGIQALKAIIGNPIDSIISLISYPFALDSLVPVTSTKIYFGKYNSLLSANSITKSSIKIDWGTVEIPFFWGGFLDYSPYTQIQLYLPWGVGFVSLDPNEVMPWAPKNSYMQGSFTNGSVRVVTNIELDKGSCVHNVIGNNGRVIGSFGGICGKQVPVVGTNDAARTLALIGAAVSAGTTLGMTATGQPALGKGLAYGKNMSQMNRAEGREMLADYNSAVSGMLASSKAAAKSPPTYPRAGTFSDATSHLAVQYPYLIISRPSQSIPKQYGRFMGYPSNIFHNHLGEVKGYTEVSSIHLDNIPATSTELDELESILKGGVLL